MPGVCRSVGVGIVWGGGRIERVRPLPRPGVHPGGWAAVTIITHVVVAVNSIHIKCLRHMNDWPHQVAHLLTNSLIDYRILKNPIDLLVYV